MKTNESANPQPDENGNRESNGGNSKVQTVDQWWEELPSAEREFAYELGKIVLGFREKNYAEVIADADKVKGELRILMQRLAAAYDNAGVQLSSGGPERWRWN